MWFCLFWYCTLIYLNSVCGRFAVLLVEGKAASCDVVITVDAIGRQSSSTHLFTHGHVHFVAWPLDGLCPGSSTVGLHIGTSTMIREFGWFLRRTGFTKVMAGMRPTWPGGKKSKFLGYAYQIDAYMYMSKLSAMIWKKVCRLFSASHLPHT